MKRNILGLMCLVAVLLCAGSAWASNRVAVLPFAVSSQEDLAYLSQGIQEMIGSQLRERGFEPVSMAEVTSAVKGKNLESMSDSEIRTIGRKTKAQTVVYGTMTKVGRRVSLDAKIADTTGSGSTRSLVVEEDRVENLNLAADKVAAAMTGPGSTAVPSGRSGSGIVADIVISGNDRIEADAILRVLESKRGEPFSETKVSADIKRIFGMNYFDDVQAFVDDSAAGKVIRFVVEEKSSIAQIEFKGNKVLDEKDLRDAVGFGLFSVQNDEKLNEGVENIQAKYREKGYVNAKVAYQLKEVGRKRVGVTYTIEEGGRLYIREIQFSGNKYFSDRKLRGEMKTATKGILSIITDSGILKKDVVDQDINRLQALYYNSGFIQAKVGDPEIKSEGNRLELTIPIEEGPQYKVGKISANGDMIVPAEELLKKAKVKEGQIYSRDKLREDVETLSSVYTDSGYAFATVTPQMQENADQKTVDINYAVEKKQLVNFERISVSGNTKTRDKVIRRELKVKEGDRFSAADLRESGSNLRKLGFFEDVQIQPSRGTSDEQMNLLVQVKEQPTGAFAIGAGYSSYDSLFGTIRVSQDNLFGTGRKLAFDVSVGGASTQYNLSFTEPWLFDIPLTAGIDVFDQTFEFDDYDKHVRGSNVRASYPIFNKTRLMGKYIYENVDVTNVSANAASIIKDSAGKTVKSSVFTMIRRDTRDRLFNPRNGNDSSFSIEYAGGPFGGDSDFTRYQAESGWFFPTPVDDVTLFFRGKAGYMAEHESNGAPIYERYFLGGMYSVRGFKYQELSPIDPATGNKIGGTKMGLFNAELIFPLYKKAGLMGVVFYDRGNVWLKEEDFSFGSMRSSYGAGLRYYSPLGPLRLEYGRIINPKTGEPSGNFEFSVGTFF